MNFSVMRNMIRSVIIGPTVTGHIHKRLQAVTVPCEKNFWFKYTHVLTKATKYIRGANRYQETWKLFLSERDDSVVEKRATSFLHVIFPFV